MFGYVKLYPEQLKPADAAQYKRVYCGLCRQMANYSMFSRLFLSFDMTFLVFLSAYDQLELAQKCAVRKCAKRVPCPDELLDYWACLSIMMVYQKLLNDVKDGKKSRNAFLFALKYPLKSVCDRYPQAYSLVCDALGENYALEDQRSPDAETLAQNFGRLAAELVAGAPYDKARSQALEEVLEHIARLVGEWIYFIDFYDDAEDDLRLNQYNPILIQAERRSMPLTDVKREFRERIDARVEELQRLCGFLPYDGYQAIVRNVLHEGIISVTGNIYNGLSADGRVRKTCDREVIQR